MNQQQGGFTLLEVLVALSIFALAATALLRLQGLNARTAIVGQEKALASLVAENHMILAQSNPVRPEVGEVILNVEQGARKWTVSKVTRPAPGGRLLRIDISVREEGTDQAVAQLSGFRKARP